MKDGSQSAILREAYLRAGHQRLRYLSFERWHEVAKRRAQFSRDLVLEAQPQSCADLVCE